MTAFATAIATIFADANMAVAATWTATATGIPVVTRAIAVAPDATTSFSDARFRSDSVLVEVPVATVTSPERGDSFEMLGVTYAIQGAPERDDLRLLWTLELVAP